MTTILKMPARPANPKTKATIHSRSYTRKMRRQGAAALAIGGVAATLVALSLNHLAHGIEVVTAAPSWEAWAMAVGIDLGFVALEGAQVTASTPQLRRHVERFTKPAIVATLAGSAAMNGFAFASQATGWTCYVAAALGIAIPALIWALTRVGGAMYLDCHSKT